MNNKSILSTGIAAIGVFVSRTVNALADGAELVVTGAERGEDVDIVISNYRGVSLPKTGSETAIMIAVIGTIVVVAGLAYYFMRKRNTVKVIGR